MKKLTSIFFVMLFTLWGVANLRAQEVPAGETDVTTLPWVNNGQDCTSDFNNAGGGTVYGTDANGSSLSYVDLSNYGVIKLYGPANQTARLFLNRAEFGDNGIFYVEIGEDGVGVFDCNSIFEKQPKAQYIHLNGVKASAWNTTLNLSLITASGDPLTYPEVSVLPEDEIDLTTLPWVNEGQDCANNLGKETGDTNYGTDAGPADGKLSYVDITKYATIKLYGRAGDVARLFINRAEFPDNFQFYVTIGEDGVGALNLATVYTTQAGAEYVHLNGIKTAATWQGSATGTAKIDNIGLVEKAFEIPEGEIDIQTLPYEGKIEANTIGSKNTGAFVIYGDQNSGDNFHVDVTNYKELKIYGTSGALVRIFVNREGNGATNEQNVKITDGVGVLDLAAVQTALSADHVWINCFKNAAGWQGGTDDPVKIDAITLTPKDAEEPQPVTLELTDILTQQSLGLSGNSYTTVYEPVTLGSGAEYAFYAATTYSAIQLNKKNNNVGIVTTKSGGKVAKIIVTWNSNTSNGRTLSFYGSNTAYTGSADLYTTENQGTLIETVKFTKPGEGEPDFVSTIVPTEKYEYLGIYASGAVYINSIEIVWEVELGEKLDYAPTFSVKPYTYVRPGSTVELLSPIEGANIYYTTGDYDNEIQYPTLENATLYTEPIVINDFLQIMAILEYKGLVSAAPAEAMYGTWPTIDNLSVVNDLCDSEIPFIYDGQVTVIYADSKNAFITDGMMNYLVYDKNGKLTLKAGDIIAAGWEGQPTIYNGMTEIIPLTTLEVAGTTDELPEPMLVEPEDADYFLKSYNRSAFLSLNGVTFAEDTPATVANFTGDFSYIEINDDDEEEVVSFEVKFRNMFAIESVPAGTYCVKGFVGVYNSDIQFYPIEFTDVVIEGPDYTEVTALSQVADIEMGTDVLVNTRLTVVYTYYNFSLDRHYAYVSDGESYGLICGDFELAPKNEILPFWGGRVLTDGMILVTDYELEIADYEAELPVPTQLSAENLATVANHEYVALDAVSFADDTPASKDAFIGKLGEENVTFVNNFGLESQEAGKYDVVGFAKVDDEGALTVFPVSFTLCKDSGINAVENLIEGARYYNLQGIQVANPENGRIYIRVANGNAAKVMLK